MKIICRSRLNTINLFLIIKFIRIQQFLYYMKKIFCKRYLASYIITCMAILAHQPTFADGAIERIIQAHPVAPYPATIPLYENEVQIQLTKDNIEQVYRFFKDRLHAGDRLQAFTDNDGTSGYRLIYEETIDGQQKLLTLLEFSSRTTKDSLHPALGELRAQMMSGKRSQADYQAIEKKYAGLNTAFFRHVTDEQGGTVSEGNKIYQEAKKRILPPKVQISEQEYSKGNARAQDIRQRMQELKAKGDTAGIVALSQQLYGSPKQTAPGAATIQAYEKDTWDDWSACLKELYEVAYWTRLKYYTKSTQQN